MTTAGTICAACQSPQSPGDLHTLVTLWPGDREAVPRRVCVDAVACNRRAKKVRPPQVRMFDTPTPKPKAPALVSVACTVCGAVEELPVVRGLRATLPARWAHVTVAEAGSRVSSLVLCVGCAGRVLVVLRRRAPVPAGRDTW